MSVLYLLAGGIEYDAATNGARFVLADSNVSGPADTTTNAPVSGLRGLTHDIAASHELYLPTQIDQADSPWIPANGSRNWIACHAEVVIEDLYGAAGEEFKCLGKMIMGAANRTLSIIGGTHTSRTSGTANAAVTATATSLTDTRKGFGAAGVAAGDFIVTSSNKHAIIATVSPDNTVNLDANGWKGGTPAAGVAYNIYSAVKYKFRITDGTTNWDSTERTASPPMWRTAPFVIDWQFKPTSGALINKLTVDNTLEITNTAGTTATPGSVKPTMIFGFGLVSKTSTFLGKYQAYNFILYDDLTQTDMDTYPLAYSATASARPLVTYRKPKSGTTPFYNAWTKSTGTDAAALLDEIRDVDLTDYVSSVTVGQKQSWKMDDLSACDYPLNTYDTVYAVQTVGDAKNIHTGLSNATKVYHDDGAGVDDAGRATYGANQPGSPVWWCAYLSPAGAAWTYTAANATETVVEVTAWATSGICAVATAGQLICFIKGVAPLGQPILIRSATVPGLHLGNSVVSRRY